MGLTSPGMKPQGLSPTQVEKVKQMARVFFVRVVMVLEPLLAVLRADSGFCAQGSVLVGFEGGCYGMPGARQALSLSELSLLPLKVKTLGPER